MAAARLSLAPSFSPEVDGTTIEAGRYNGLTSRYCSGDYQRLTKDGQENVPTANLPMGSRKLTGLAAGAAAGDSVRFEQANVIGETTVTGSASLRMSSRLRLLGCCLTGRVSPSRLSPLKPRYLEVGAV